MKVKFVGVRAREVAAAGFPPFTIQPGEEADLPARLARSLLDQPQWFQPVKPSKPDKENDQ